MTYIYHCFFFNLVLFTFYLYIQANINIADEKNQIFNSRSYDSIKTTMSGGTVNSYDGFRLIVQKQLNLNTLVSHFYWIGSQNTQQPIYQYRMIIPFDETTVVNVATDPDFNLEGEIRFPITKDITSKSQFTVYSIYYLWSHFVNCMIDY